MEDWEVKSDMLTEEAVEQLKEEMPLDFETSFDNRSLVPGETIEWTTHDGSIHRKAVSSDDLYGIPPIQRDDFELNIRETFEQRVQKADVPTTDVLSFAGELFPQMNLSSRSRGKGDVILRLFDDGWRGRVKEINLAIECMENGYDMVNRNNVHVENTGSGFLTRHKCLGEWTEKKMISEEDLSEVDELRDSALGLIGESAFDKYQLGHTGP